MVTVKELIVSIVHPREFYVEMLNPVFGLALYGFTNVVAENLNVVPAVLAAEFVTVRTLVVVS